jgi:hypothetical protein
MYKSGWGDKHGSEDGIVRCASDVTKFRCQICTDDFPISPILCHTSVTRHIDTAAHQHNKARAMEVLKGVMLRLLEERGMAKEELLARTTLELPATAVCTDLRKEGRNHRQLHSQARD